MMEDSGSTTSGIFAVAGGGFTSIYISDTGLDRWNLKRGVRVTDIVSWKLIKKADILNDIQEAKDKSEWNDLKEKIEVRSRKPNTNPIHIEINR